VYKLDYHKRVIKFLAKQDLKFREKVLDIFDEIAVNPYSSNYDIKPYKSPHNNSYRLRLGKYRFIYKIDANEIVIYVSDADSRGDVYK